MQYLIRHTTEYIYDESVSFTPHLMRLFPRTDDRIRISDYQLKVFPEGSIYWLRDPYDNTIAKFFTTEVSRQLSVTVDATIEHRQETAFDFLLDSHAIKFPFSYSENEREILLPYISTTDKLPAIDDWLKESEININGDTTRCLSDLLEYCHRSIQYQRRDDPGIRTPEETIASRSGTCRDYAVLFMKLCNCFGLATRFVSGYLYASSDDSDTLGADSIHAWTDVYLPGAGWRGLDPTNGIWCSYCHIPLAVSKTPEETTPIEGNYCADQVIKSEMKTQLSIQKPSCKHGDK